MARIVRNTAALLLIFFLLAWTHATFAEDATPSAAPKPLAASPANPPPPVPVGLIRREFLKAAEKETVLRNETQLRAALEAVSKHLQQPPKIQRTMFKGVDRDSDGSVDWFEFHAFLLGTDPSPTVSKKAPESDVKDTPANADSGSQKIEPGRPDADGPRRMTLREQNAIKRAEILARHDANRNGDLDPEEWTDLVQTERRARWAAYAGNRDGKLNPVELSSARTADYFVVWCYSFDKNRDGVFDVEEAREQNRASDTLDLSNPAPLPLLDELGALPELAPGHLHESGCRQPGLFQLVHARRLYN
jgi:hypothetical protein